MTESKFREDFEVESKFADDRCGEESKSAGRKAAKSHGESKNGSGEEVSIMLKATNYCFSPEFIGVFEDYIENNAHIFYDAVRENSDEHALEFTELFNDYLKLYEKTMEKWLRREGISLGDFNDALKEAVEGDKISEKYVF